MRNRTPLVCQHLENISRKALEKYQGLVKGYVGSRHGVYALYRKNKLYYVGLARDLRLRLGHHLKDRHQNSWNRFSVYLTIGDDHLRELEALVLRIVHPPGNRTKGNFGRSEDMRRRFRRDARAAFQGILNSLFDDGSPRRGLVRLPSVRKGRQPVLAAYMASLRNRTLRARFKGKALRATLLRNGLVRFQGRLFTSPSVAAARACRRSTCNGWVFWKYERAPGDWVLIDKLRK